MNITSDEKRLSVLVYSLRLEEMASYSLATLLDIKFDTVVKTKSLGNTSTSLSFNQKVNLLLDSESITKDEKLKLESFMNIRNQFIHNGKTSSYVDVVNQTDGLLKRIERIYPDEFKEGTSIELSLEKCTERLFIDGLKILISDKGAKGRKLNTMAQATVFKKYWDNTPLAIDKALNLLIDDIIAEKFDYQDKDQLIENIKVLKLQILLYQQTIDKEEIETTHNTD